MKQLHGVTFYRQKPIGDYIVDFYAPRAMVVVEVDGSQHLEEEQTLRDQQRDGYLQQRGLLVLRFTNLEVLNQLDSVADAVYRAVGKRLAQ